MPWFRRGPKTATADRPIPVSLPAASPGATRDALRTDAPWREDRVIEFGLEILERARGHKSGLFSKQFWSDKLMDWSMRDHEFKVQFFRFVDAFPVLRHSPEAVYDHLKDYMEQPGVTPPPGMASGIKAGGVAKGVFSKTIAGQIEGMGRKFIAGTDAKDALPQLEKLWKNGIGFSVDLLGEACVSSKEADAYLDKYMDLVQNLPETVRLWVPNEQLENDHLGPIPRTNVSIKISSLSAQCDPIDPDGAIADMKSRILPILNAARERGVFINFDMEHYALKDLTLRLFMECCEEVEFEAGIAMQAYLRSGDEDARTICQWAKRTGRQVSVRLVKGAYWDAETIHAELEGWHCPVWSVKRDSDACFERMTEAFLDATPRSQGEGGVKLALGSHNARSIGAALDGLERRGLPSNAIELQMLHGMADQLKHAGTEMGLRVREYVPVGEMIPGMAYLVRRLLENTSNESWLKAGFLDNAEPTLLLASPHDAPGAERPQDLSTIANERHILSPAIEGVGDGRPFFTTPVRDFAEADQRENFARAAERAEVPRVALDATAEDAERAIDDLHAFFPTWRDTDPIERATIIDRAADLMTARRDEFSGVIMKENGKPRREADADVTEAIDFCRYYARSAPALFQRDRLGRFIGELDQLWHEPRGVAAVISPWNFPLAISCGMTTAALVTGNTVALKPAEQTPAIAKLLVDILFQAGLPKDALRFLSGPGETVGAALVRDPRTALIAFTGSKAVGLDIIRAAGIVDQDAGQQHVKKVLCEMGGKNAIIIDTSADIDEAVIGVRYSAFGFSGQKCSACSRCIIVDPEGPDGTATRNFLDRFVPAVEAFITGDPMLPGTDMGPVIDEEAANTIMAAIERAKQEIGPPALEMEHHTLPEDSPTIPKRVIGPTIFTGVRPEHDLARNEVFGPVLAVMHALSYDEAIRIANDHHYKLTGAVYTRKPVHIERAKREFRVGNLYINRPCTGALVARHPFGGFALSGVGSKAGGPEYLEQFVVPRACAENTMRRGFAPEL